MGEEHVPRDCGGHHSGQLQQDGLNVCTEIEYSKCVGHNFLFSVSAACMHEPFVSFSGFNAGHASQVMLNFTVVQEKQKPERRTGHSDYHKD